MASDRGTILFNPIIPLMGIINNYLCGINKSETALGPETETKKLHFASGIFSSKVLESLCVFVISLVCEMNLYYYKFPSFKNIKFRYSKILLTHLNFT
jgi:hypothetical protein